MRVARTKPPTPARDPTSVPPANPGMPSGAGASAQGAAAVVRALGYMTLVALAILFLWLTLRVDLVIFAGVLLAIWLRRVADIVSRPTGLSGGWALGAVVLLILVVLAGIGWGFSQAIAGQINELSQALPAAAQKVGEMVGQSGIGKTIMQHLNFGQTQTSLTSAVQSFFGVAANIAEVVGAVVVMLFLAIYFAAEAQRYADALLRLVPPARRRRAGEVEHETANALWYWMLGRMFSMTVLGLLTAVGLWGLGVPLPVTLGFLAGIMTFVPYIGSIASAIPSVLIAASISFQLALYVIILYIGVHVIEGYILVPLVQRRVVHLPPALILSAQIILGVLAGFLGLLLATPLVAAIVVLVRMLYVEDVLGDHAAANAQRR